MSILQGYFSGTTPIPPMNPLAKRAAEERFMAALTQYHQARAEYLPYQHLQEFRLVVFGSARITEDEQEYQDVVDLTAYLSEHMKIDIVTGGGPSIMHAAFEGVKRTHPDSQEVLTHGVTICIRREEEQSPDADWQRNHLEFLTRIQEMVDLSHATYVAPGGIGTLLELSTCLQLKQVGHLPPWFPIIVHPMWRSTLMTFKQAALNDRIAAGKTATISEGDVVENIHITEDKEEILHILTAAMHCWEDEKKHLISH